MPSHPKLEDPSFTAKLDHAFRLRSDGHLSLRAAATIAGIATSALQRWERRLSGVDVPRGSMDVARAALRAKRAAATCRRREPVCTIVMCSTCHAHVMDDGEERWDAVGDLPVISGVLCVPHRCARASVPPSQW